MYDKEIVCDLLKKIREATEKISSRFAFVNSISDLTDSSAGSEKLDLLCMPLIVIGEMVKKIDKITDNSLLAQYPDIPWKEIKGMRDIVAHDYFNLNAEEIFNTCQDDIPKFAKTIELIISDTQQN